MKDVTENWTAIPALPYALQIVNRLTGRVFVGPELYRQPEYIRKYIIFTADAAMVRNDLQQHNQFLRPWVTPFLFSLKRVKRHLRDAKNWIDPIIAELLSKISEKTKTVAAGSRGAWISWLLKYLPDHEKTSKRLGLIQRRVGPILDCLRHKSNLLIRAEQVSFASLHTITSATTNVVRLTNIFRRAVTDFRGRLF